MECITCQSLPIHPFLQLLQQLRSILGPILAVLFKLDDVIAYEPVAHRLHAIDCFYCGRLCCIMSSLNDRSQVVEGVERLIPILKRQFHAVVQVSFHFVCHNILGLDIQRETSTKIQTFIEYKKDGEIVYLY